MLQKAMDEYVDLADYGAEEEHNDEELTVHEYTIDEVRVQFPFEAYPCQLEMLTNIIKTLNGSRENALLESPTGSGKSMVLLCGVLAWLEHKNRQLQEEEERRQVELNSCLEIEEYGSDTDFDDNDDFVTIPPPGKKSKSQEEKKMEELPFSSKLPKIFICSRTHRQIAQLVKELRRTTYQPNFTVLGSRAHYCINEKLRRQSGKDLNESCRKACKSQHCSYFNSMFKQKKRIRSAPPNCDIEELVQRGRTQRFCPYFAARLAIEKAQLVFAPYNYLIDPVVREAMGVELDNDIIIIDEAHNVEDICREGGSFEITDDQLGQLELELQGICRGLDIYDPNKLLEAHTIQGHVVSIWKNWLRHEDKGRGRVRTDFETTVTTWQDNLIIEELNALGFTFNYLSQGMNCLKKIMDRALEMKEDPQPPAELFQRLREHLNDNTASGPYQDEGAPTMTLSVGSCQILMSFYYSLTNLLRDNNRYLSAYRMVKYQTTKIDPNAGKRFIFTLGLWCLNPEVTFNQLLHGSKSVILTSGTLSPMDSFASELATHFDHRLEASHIIDRKQTWVGCVPVGPSGATFLGNFKTMDSFAYQDDLAQAILGICEIVPAGVLCFLPSYTFMDKLMRRMKNTGVYQQLSRCKYVLEEPKQGSPQVFESLLKKYYRHIRDTKVNGLKRSPTGALLFAIYRGKISEGLDLKDDNCRAVIPVGIPYPAFKDPKVVLKREFNDSQPPPRKLLSGQKWYEIQAFRALNQALGRCIRHRHDWGAIVLLEERFATAERNVRQLSKWVRERLVVHNKFEPAIESLGQFIKLNMGEEEEKNNSTTLSTIDMSKQPVDDVMIIDNSD